MTGRCSKKSNLDPATLARAVSEVASVAKKEGVRVALIGGLALQHYGSDRLTGDVDVVAEGLISGFAPGSALTFGGEATHTSKGVPLDVILRSDDFAKLYEEALDQAVRVRGVPMPIVRPEYLVAMKMVAKRAKDSGDLDFLITSGAVDLAEARKIVKKHFGAYGAQDFDQIVALAQWRASRGL